jgi:hypothetical protein
MSEGDLGGELADLYQRTVSLGAKAARTDVSLSELEGKVALLVERLKVSYPIRT